MNFNNAPIIKALEPTEPPSRDPERRVPRRRVTSEPCLPERLPTSGSLHYLTYMLLN